MKKISPITSGILQAIGIGFSITLLFIFSFAVLAAYGQSFLQWMDSSPRTGIVLLCIGCFSFVFMFFYSLITKR